MVCTLGFGWAEVDMQKPVPLAESLKISAEVMNKSLPTMIDSELRHDKVEAKGNTLVFKYTLVNFTQKEMSAEKLSELMEKDTKQGVCSDKDSLMMLEKGMTLIYEYSDKNGKPITQFTFDAEACGIESEMDKLKQILNLTKNK